MPGTVDEPDVLNSSFIGYVLVPIGIEYSGLTWVLLNVSSKSSLTQPDIRMIESIKIIAFTLFIN